ncbi:YdjY domain-containing protein [Neobacillus novalis]|uniref:YdjY domain-containing protein n=1 Tax=Neobacillus novalis TaxID=220687 RepID=A0AA95MQ12_9BACI|nr:YdjY domain-containing protein [Neobacillus novalis]WHY87826.1 YdjY domain-containing protein [Neobacillus novalis]
MKKKSAHIFKFLILAALAMVVLSACSSKSTSDSKDSPTNTENKEGQNAEQVVTKEHPIYIDKEKKVVKVYATVNGKYLVTPTRHGLNWVEGKYGNQSVLSAYANPLKFNEALKEIDGTPAVEKGGDASKEFEEKDGGKYILGDQVLVTVTWADAKKEYDINDVMVDSTGKKIVYRFGGNYDVQAAKMTGCYMCFDSCPAGITSNSNQPVGTFDGGHAEFHGNAKVLPKDGTPVILTYSIEK